MKELSFILIPVLLLPAFISAQNYVKQQKLIIPITKKLLPGNTGKNQVSYKDRFLSTPVEPGNRLSAFFRGDPILNFSFLQNRSVLVSPELSYSDLIENTIGNFNDRLINKYDDLCPELFRDAPSLFKIKCVIDF